MVAARRPRLREIAASSDPAIAQGHALLRRTFEKAEVVSSAEWRESLLEREGGLWTDMSWHLVVAELRGMLVGIASGTYLGNVNTGVIGYLAVSPAARGFGLGPRLRAKLRTLFHRDARRIARQPLRAVVGEVRRDNPWLRTLARREQVLVLDFEYHQPRLHRGARPVPLVFYYESLDRIVHRLSNTRVRRILFTIWRRVYRVGRPMANPTFRRMLGQLPAGGFVRRLRPGDLSTSPSGAHRGQARRTTRSTAGGTHGR